MCRDSVSRASLIKLSDREREREKRQTQLEKNKEEGDGEWGIDKKT